MWRKAYNICQSPSTFLLLNAIPRKYATYIPFFHGVLSKVYVRDQVYCPLHVFSVINHRGLHSTQFLKRVDKCADSPNQTKPNSPAQDSSKKPKRKKLKGVDEYADSPNQTKPNSPAQDSSKKPKRKKLKGVDECTDSPNHTKPNSPAQDSSKKPKRKKLKGVDECADSPNQTKPNSPAQDSSKKPKRKKLKGVDECADSPNQTKPNSPAQDSSEKPKRKKLIGRKQVVKWVKKFRNKKKKAYQCMTAEEKILFKLSKARKKETRYLEALKKLEPKELSEATHDPEVLTQEEHFYFLKMGLKCKNYVPVGRRGVYQGVILNMHLHWKKHETLQVIVKTFTPEEVKEMAVELAKLTGGIVLDIYEEETIIMYRGKNYSQPPVEIMSPRVTLPRIKAFFKSNHRQALREVRIHIARLEQRLEILGAHQQYVEDQAEDASRVDSQNFVRASMPISKSAPTDKLMALLDEYKNTVQEYDSMTDGSMDSESEDLSDMFETDSDDEGNTERSLGNINDPKRVGLSTGSPELTDIDEVDQIFVRAAELLKKKRL